MQNKKLANINTTTKVNSCKKEKKARKQVFMHNILPVCCFFFFSSCICHTYTFDMDIVSKQASEQKGYHRIKSKTGKQQVNLQKKKTKTKKKES